MTRKEKYADRERRRPHNLAPDAWYYECEKGIEVYYERIGLVCIIPWRKVKAALSRKEEGK